MKRNHPFVLGHDIVCEESFGDAPIGKTVIVDSEMDGECYEYSVAAKHKDGTFSFLVDGKLQRGKVPMFWIPSEKRA